MEKLLDDFRREMQQKLDQLTAKVSNPVTASPAPGGIPPRRMGSHPQVEVGGAAIGQASGAERLIMWKVMRVGN